MGKVVSLEEEKKKVLLRDKVLVESSFSISATENKILYCILQNAQVRRDDELHCSMEPKDFYAVVSKNEHKTPKYIKECLNRLMCVQYKFWNDEIEGNYNLIAGWIRNKETGVFEISIPKEIYKRLMQQEVYSPLDLSVITSLKSFYSQRLYELLRLWSRNGKEITQTFTVEYIRFILGAEDVCKQFKHLNQYVKTAVKDIESKTKMSIEHEVIKVGRKAVKFKFKITDEDARIFFSKEKQENNSGEVKFDGSEMTNEVRKYFEKDFGYCDMENEHIQRAYEQSCKETMKHTLCKRIGKDQYGYFSQIFGNKVAWIETAWDYCMDIQ